MNDMRRTLLWVVFSMSLVLIWDAWNKHNGNPSMFGPAAGGQAGSGRCVDRARRTAGAGAGQRRDRGDCGAGRHARRPCPRPRPPLRQPERVDGHHRRRQGHVRHPGRPRWCGSSCSKQRDQTRSQQEHGAARPVGQARCTWRRPGLIPPAGGAGLPNHHTVMTLVPGDRDLKRRQQRAAGAVRVAGGRRREAGQDLHLQARRLRHRREARGRSTARRAAVSPRLYLQLVRDGNPPAGESSFYFTFTGPAIYTDATKFQKIDFKTIEKHKAGDKPDHATSGDNGWVAMVQHYFASAWLVDNGSGAKLPREFFTGKVDTNTYSVGMFVPLGEVAAGHDQGLRCAALRRPAGRKQARRAGARARAGEGLRLVHDPGQAAVLAADAAARAASATGAGRSSRWWCC